MIITLSTVEVERDAISSQLSDHKIKLINNIPILFGDYESAFGPIHVGSVHIGYMGSTKAAITAGALLAEIKPKRMSMFGIAAGIGDSVNNGDILICERSVFTELGKVTEGEDGLESFHPTIAQAETRSRLLALIEMFRSNINNSEKIRKSWRGKESAGYLQTHRGSFFCGNKVVARAKTIADLLLRDRKGVGLDMESYGLLAMQDYYEDVDFYVIKSVSDKGDSAKGDDYQRYAAFTSCKFLLEFEGFLQHNLGL